MVKAQEYARKRECDHKIYLNVPFSVKDEAKLRTARWSKKDKLWYCGENCVRLMELEWFDLKLNKGTMMVHFESPSIEEYQEIFDQGARWDAEAKKWYLPASVVCEVHQNRKLTRELKPAYKKWFEGRWLQFFVKEEPVQDFLCSRDDSLIIGQVQL